MPSGSTRGQLAKTLGVHPDTIKAWRKSGRIPAPDGTNERGWLTWSPHLVQRIIRERTNRGSNT